MLPEQFAYLGSFFLFVSVASYLYAVWKGTAQPNRVTYFVWTLAPLITGIAQYMNDSISAAIISFTLAISAALILALSFHNKNAYWKSSPSDYVCGFFALIGLVLWQVTSNPNYAVAFSILSDLLAAVPTIRKATTNPESENGLAYMLAVIGGTIGLLSIHDFSFVGLGFAIWYVICCAIITFLVYRKKLGFGLIER